MTINAKQIYVKLDLIIVIYVLLTQIELFHLNVTVILDISKILYKIQYVQVSYKLFIFNNFIQTFILILKLII